MTKPSKANGQSNSTPISFQSRRKFLKTSAAATAGVIAAASLKSSIAIAKPPNRGDLLYQTNSLSFQSSLKVDPKKLIKSQLFPLGIASGDVSQNDAILWTYYEGFFRLQIIVWEQKRNHLVQVASIPVSRSDGGFVHVLIESLLPGQKYVYAFVEIDFTGHPISISRLGHFRAALAHDQLEKITLGAVCCTKNSFEPVVLEHASKRSDIDAFMFLGDTSYNDSVKSLHGYRDRWATNLRKKGYKDLRAKTSIIATLDDHEITDNFDPETIEPERFNAAMQAFFDHLPIRRLKQSKARVWRKLKWGATAEIFVLDCRTERRPSTRYEQNAQYISREQMNWLKDGLESSTSVFKIIMNSVPITDFPFPMSRDRWEGYPAQRNEILEFIDSNEISGVIWISGDFHFACAGRISTRGPGRNHNEFLIGPGAQSPNWVGLALKINPQFDFVSMENNYATITLDPHSKKAKVEYHMGGNNPRHIGIKRMRVGFSKTYQIH